MIGRATGRRDYAFVLVPHFSMITLTSSIEPLRHANRMSGRELYRWSIYSEDGGATPASNGIEVTVSGSLAHVPERATVMLCGGPDIERHTSRVLIDWLRRIARHGRDIAALCTAPHILAQAGLLDGYRCTTHWEDIGRFQGAVPRPRRERIPVRDRPGPHLLCRRDRGYRPHGLDDRLPAW